jgi:transposase
MAETEIIRVERRRRWSEADKQQIVAETLAPGASVSEVARRHGMHPSQLFTWRRAAREGALNGCGAQFAPVLVRSERQHRPVESVAGDRLEIVLLSGRRIVVAGGVDASVLARVVAVLERR